MNDDKSLEKRLQIENLMDAALGPAKDRAGQVVAMTWMFFFCRTCQNAERGSQLKESQGFFASRY